MRRTGVFPQGCGGGVRSDGVEGARVGDDGQPLPPVRRNPGGEPHRRDEMVTEHLYEALRGAST